MFSFDFKTEISENENYFVAVHSTFSSLSSSSNPPFRNMSTVFSEVGALQDESPDINVCIKPLCFEWSLDRWLAVSKCTMEKVLDLTLR